MNLRIKAAATVLGKQAEMGTVRNPEVSNVVEVEDE